MFRYKIVVGMLSAIGVGVGVGVYYHTQSTGKETKDPHTVDGAVTNPTTSSPSPNTTQPPANNK